MQLNAPRPPDLAGRGYQRRYDTRGHELEKHPSALTADQIVGPWSAWKCRPSDEQRARHPASLDMWWIFAPGAHPLWHWHAILGCTLLPIAGLPPAKVVVPNATHEFLIGALDPDWDPSPHVDNPELWGRYLLKPVNMAHQVTAFTDELANELLFMLTRAFCYGHSSPDDDFKTANAELIDGTADHLRRGLHMPS